MQIILNGQQSLLTERATLADLLDTLKLAGKRIAVELNGDIVPRSRWADSRLGDGDRVEIVKAIGGG